MNKKKRKGFWATLLTPVTVTIEETIKAGKKGLKDEDQEDKKK